MEVPAIIAALLLPIAVFLVENSNGKNKNEIDLNIIIDKVLVAKKFLLFFFIGLITLSCVDIIKWPAVVYDISLAIFTLYILNNTRKWLSVSEVSGENDYNYKQQLRYQYYTSQKNVDEIYHTWKMIFENIDVINQSHIVDAFIEVTQNLDLNEKMYETEQDRMINLLMSNIGKMSFSDPVEYEKLIVFLASYYYDEYVMKRNENRHPAEAKRKLLNLLVTNAVVSRSNNYHFYERIIFKELENLDLERLDVRFFLYNIFSAIKDAYGKSDDHLYGVWENDFLKNLQIKIDKNDTNDSSITNAYFNELSRDIRGNDIDVKIAAFIDNLTEAIFEKIDPIMWFDFYTFREYSFGLIDGKSETYSRIVNWCGLQRNFGLIGRMDSSVLALDLNDFDSEEEKTRFIEKEFRKQYDDERRATFIMLTKIFDFVNNLDFINEVLNEIKKIKKEKIWKDDEDEKIKNYRLLKLESDFLGLKNFLENKRVE